MATRRAPSRGKGSASRKPRKSNLEPYTNDYAVSVIEGNPNEWENVLVMFFDRADVERDVEKYISPIAKALSRYTLSGQQDQTTTSQQRADLRNLIRCLKAFDLRLERIPRPVREAMNAAYSPLCAPLVRGKGTLREEVNDLRFRAKHLLGIIESIKIPTPSRTNPGKPARDNLIQELGAIFDELASPPDPRRKKRFIEKILSLYIKKPRSPDPDRQESQKRN